MNYLSIIKIRRPLLLLLLIFTVSSSYSLSRNEGELDKNTDNKILAFIDSAKAIEKFDIEKAISHYQSAITLSEAQSEYELMAQSYYGIINLYFSNYNYEKTFQYADTLEKKAVDSHFKMLAIQRKGDALWYTGKFDSAAYHFHIVKDLSIELGDSLRQGAIRKDLGDYYRQIGNYKEAIVYFEESISILTALKDTSILPGAYNNFSIVFSSLGDYHKELEYLLKALELKEKSNDYAALALYTKNIADVYIDLKEYETALVKCRESLRLLSLKPDLRIEIYVKETTGRLFYKLGNYDSASSYFSQALILSDSISEKRYQARISKCLGDIARKRKNYTLSDSLYNRSLTYYQEIEDPVHEVKTYLSLAENAIQLGKIEAASSILIKAKSIASKYGNKVVLLNVYSLLSTFHESQSNYKKSIYYHKKRDSLSSIVFNEDRVKFISANEIIYETKNRELENTKLKQDIVFQNDAYSKQSMRLKLGSIVSIAILMIAISLYYAYRKTRLSKLKIAVQNKQLQQKNQEVEEANQQQMDLIHLVAHDLKSPLNKITGLANILKLEAGLNKEQLGIIDMMESTTNESRKFIINLLEAQDVERQSLEPNFERLNIVEITTLIKKELEQLAIPKNQKVIYSNTVDSKVFITADLELLQHVFINLCSNAVKFSPRDSAIYFTLECENEYLNIHIQDEGPGFTIEDKKKIYLKFQKLSARPTNNESSTGLGLYLAKVLIEKMNGTIKLNNSKKGAHFTVKLPIINSN